jgi:hypothetical protein
LSDDDAQVYVAPLHRDITIAACELTVDAAWVRRQREAHVIGRRGIERHLQGDGIV